MENYDPNKLNQNAAPDVLPQTQRMNRRDGILGAVIGLGTTALTLLNLNNKSRVDNFKADLEATPLNVTGTNVTSKILSLAGEIKNRFADADLEKATNKATKSLKSIQKKGNLSNEAKDELKNFLGKDPNSGLQKLINFVFPKGKGKGAINTTARAAGAAIAGTAQAAKGFVKGSVEGVRRVGFDVGNVKGQKKQAATDLKIQKVGEQFEKDALSAAAKASDTKIKIGDYAKNAGIAIIAGAVVMGATMAISKFIEKRRESRNMAQHTEALEFEREMAMVNPQTQMSVQ